MVRQRDIFGQQPSALVRRNAEHVMRDFTDPEIH